MPSRGSSVRLSPSKSNLQRRHRVVEQAVPCGRGADRLVEEQPLEVVGELMRLLLADVLEPGAVMAERRRRHRGVQLGVVDAIELELEEQEIAGQRRHALLRVAVEFRDSRIAGVGGVEQRRIGHDAAGQVLQRLVGPDRLGERLAGVRPVGQLRELAAIGFGERLGFALGALEIGGEARRVHAFVQILKAPLRQRAEIRAEAPTATRRRRGNGT